MSHHYQGDDDGGGDDDDDGDEYTNLCLISLLPAAFYSYTLHFPSPSPSFTITIPIHHMSQVVAVNGPLYASARMLNAMCLYNA